MTNKAKQVEQLEELSLDMIAKSHEKFENVLNAPVHLDIDGEIQTFNVEIYKIFSPVKVYECVHEFIKNMDRARKVDRDGFGDILEPYLIWLIIKHFTVNLGEKMPNDFPQQLMSLKTMIETSALFQIVQYFEEEQIETVKEQLEVLLATFEDGSKDFKKMQEKYRELLVDKSLMD